MLRTTREVSPPFSWFAGTRLPIPIPGMLPISSLERKCWHKANYSSLSNQTSQFLNSNWGQGAAPAHSYSGIHDSAEMWTQVYLNHSRYYLLDCSDISPPALAAEQRKTAYAANRISESCRPDLSSWGAWVARPQSIARHRAPRQWHSSQSLGEVKSMTPFQSHSRLGGS